MGDSKTFSYPKTNTRSNSSQSGDSSRTARKKASHNQSQNFEQPSQK